MIGSEKTSYHFYAFIKTWNINYSKFIIFSRNINQLNFIKEKLPDIKKGLITNNNPANNKHPRTSNNHFNHSEDKLILNLFMWKKKMLSLKSISCFLLNSSHV